MIKIDVEGAEREVLEGAIETIVRYKPTVVFEHGKGAAPHYATGPRDVYALLCAQAGLRIFDLDGQGPFDLAEFERISIEEIVGTSSPTGNHPSEHRPRFARTGAQATALEGIAVSPLRRDDPSVAPAPHQ